LNKEVFKRQEKVEIRSRKQEVLIFEYKKVELKPLEEIIDRKNMKESYRT